MIPAIRMAGAAFGVAPGAAPALFTDWSDETIDLLRPWLAHEDTDGRAL